MKLYLSSFELGNCPDALQSMIGANKRVAVILNAGDPWSDTARHAETVQKQFDFVRSVGLEPEELDLRHYFGKQEELEKDLQDFGTVWVRGGNAFILRRAYRQSGFDAIIKKRLEEDTIVYAGYSAGLCVMTPSLHGIELCDDPHKVSSGYSQDIIWEGLGIIADAVAPHYKSDHPETHMIDQVIAFWQENKIPFRTLRDGQAIVVNGNQEYIVG